MGTRNIRMVLAYDGTNFFGWQVQKQGRTVQGAVQDALQRMHKHPVHVHAAGRTDTGVHASGQVINFFSDIDSIPADRFFLALNSYLPEDVKALSSGEADETFHARYSARIRVYKYYYNISQVTLPQHSRYSVHLKKIPDMATLNRFSAALIGVHDFSAFTVPRDPSPSKVREILSAGFYPEGPFLVFTIAGNAFLWRMVRSIVGTIVELAQEQAGTDALLEILESRDWSRSGATAPAKGLFFHKVVYHGENDLY